MRCGIKIIIFSFLAACFFSSFTPAQAGMKTFTEDYTYQAGRLDNKASARVITLEGVKERLWSRLWSHLEELTEVKNLQLTAEQIPAFVPILASVRIVDEKWEGRTYRIRAELSVPSGSEPLAQTLRALAKNLVRTKELIEMRDKRESILKKIIAAKNTASKKYASLVRELSALDWLLRGYVAENSGSWPEARKAFDNALKLDRKNHSAFYHRGMALLKAGQKRGAIRDFTRSITINRGNDRVYYMRGLAYAGEKKDREAIIDFSKAIKINDQFFQAHVQRGLALDRSGKSQEALKDLTRAIELNPGEPQVYFTRGAIHSKLGHEREAKIDFAKAVRLDQTKTFSQSLSQRPLAKSGNDLNSLKDLDLSIARDPGDAEAYYQRGMIHDSMGNHQQALQDLSKSIELNPKNAAAYFMRGLVYGMIDIQADSISDMKISARLGYKPAQDYMSAKGMKW